MSSCRCPLEPTLAPTLAPTLGPAFGLLLLAPLLQPLFPLERPPPLAQTPQDRPPASTLPRRGHAPAPTLVDSTPLQTHRASARALRFLRQPALPTPPLGLLGPLPLLHAFAGSPPASWPRPPAPPCASRRRTPRRLRNALCHRTPMPAARDAFRRGQSRLRVTPNARVSPSSPPSHRPMPARAPGFSGRVRATRQRPPAHPWDAPVRATARSHTHVPIDTTSVRLVDSFDSCTRTDGVTRRHVSSQCHHSSDVAGGFRPRPSRPRCPKRFPCGTLFPGQSPAGKSCHRRRRTFRRAGSLCSREDPNRLRRLVGRTRRATW